MSIFSDRTAESFARSYENLQDRFAGQIEVVKPEVIIRSLDPKEVLGKEEALGFRDISATARELQPLYGRVLLYLNRREQTYQPTVITAKNDKLQMTILQQAFDPNVGITSGMLFGLGLKHETAQDSFGAHTKSKGFEAGHFAPVMLGASSVDVRNTIVQHGDRGTHSVGSDVGGVPEKMIHTGLLQGISLKTVNLDKNNPYPLPIAWHPQLENDEGMMSATYDGPTSPIQLMLGAASNTLGARALDNIGNLVEDSIRGR